MVLALLLLLAGTARIGGAMQTQVPSSQPELQPSCIDGRGRLQPARQPAAPMAAPVGVPTTRAHAAQPHHHDHHVATVKHAAGASSNGSQRSLSPPRLQSKSPSGGSGPVVRQPVVKQPSKPGSSKVAMKGLADTKRPVSR